MAARMAARAVTRRLASVSAASGSRGAGGRAARWQALREPIGGGAGNTRLGVSSGTARLSHGGGGAAPPPPRVPKPPQAGGGGSGGGGGPFGWYMELLSAYPFATKITTTGVLNLFGDIFAQVFIDGKGMSDIDWKRSGIFFALGVGFVGPALSVWYGVLNKLIAAPTTAGAVKRLLLDQFVWAPIFITGFFAALLTCEGRPQQIPAKLESDLKDAVLTNWKLWIPAQFINFRFMPPQLQVLFANAVALVWNTYLAWATHK